MAKNTTDSHKSPERKKKSRSPDELIKSGKIEKAELSEDDLKKVGGGTLSVSGKWAG